MDPRYNLFAPELDPYLVLMEATEDEVINLQNILPLDSLYKARYLLPDGDPDLLIARKRPTENATSAIVPSAAASKPTLTNTFQTPFTSLAASFEEGPMNLLKRSLNMTIKVKVKRRHGICSWCTGVLIGFDRHWNIILSNTVESYSIKEEVFVSKRPTGIKERLVSLLSDFCSPETANQQAEHYLVQFGSDEDSLFRHLHDKFGIRQIVIDCLQGNANKADALLKRRAGHERQLIAQLYAKQRNEPLPSPVDTADWVRLPSESYPGSYFFLNNRTKQSTWEQPEGIQFRRVNVSTRREKHYSHLLIRGDSILLVSSKNT